MKLPSLRSRADVTTNTGFISKRKQASGKKHALFPANPSIELHVNRNTFCEGNESYDGLTK